MTNVTYIQDIDKCHGDEHLNFMNNAEETQFCFDCAENAGILLTVAHQLFIDGDNEILYVLDHLANHDDFIATTAKYMETESDKCWICQFMGNDANTKRVLFNIV